MANLASIARHDRFYLIIVISATGALSYIALMKFPHRVAVLIYDGVNAIDVAGPMEAFATARRDGGARAYELIVWGIGALSVTSESGLRLGADALLPKRARADTLIVPGGAGVREPKTLETLARFLRTNQEGFARIATVCTGSYALAQSGLANGRTICTHWAHGRDMAQRFPEVGIDADALFLKDGRFYSSGGVTAGIDLSLELIETDLGARASMKVARELVVFLRRTGGQAQFSEPLKMQTTADGKLGEACRWAAANLSGDLSIEALAKRARLSPRQFARRFSESFGVSPASYIRSLRLDAARSALAQGTSVAETARVTGFRGPDAFRRAFESRFNLAPRDYQNRFVTKKGQKP